MLDTDKILSGLEALRRRINAPFLECELTPLPKPEITIDIDTPEKVDAAKEFFLNHPSGIFTIDRYSGIFLLYIPYVTPGLPLPKFHFMPCSAIRRMDGKGMLDRYRLTSDLSGEFMMSDGTCQKLEVCRNCLKEYTGRRMWQGHNDFTIGKLVDSTADLLPREYIDRVRMGVILPNEYPKNWVNISNVLRELKHWRCSQCGADLHERPGLLHVHHINKIRSDTSPANLRVLCKLCHAKIHPSMNVTDEEAEYIRSKRNS